ncbi:MAG TPA: carbon-nitrogen hydrolase family protein [Bacteroidales bacterium]|nr:carbon-nitrogen hydrolase family protein [Bacteroidales bacterium]
MKRLLSIIYTLLFMGASSSFAQERNLVQNPGFEQADQSGNFPSGWKLISPRREIAPGYIYQAETKHSGNKAVSLKSAGNTGTYGFIITTVKGIQSPKREIKQQNTLNDSVFMSNESYLVSAYYRTSGMDNPDRNVSMKITWLDEKGNGIFTEFVSQKTMEGEWVRISELKTSPLNATAMNINLILQWTETGAVTWDDVSVEKAQPEKQVTIRAASASSWPKNPSTTDKNLQFYSDMILKAGNAGSDILCLGEGITIVSTGRSFADVAEPIPGPSTRILGEAARKAHTWVIAGLYEREGLLIYNTAVLIDRAGNVAGRYRKTHLPQTEVEGGLTPGNEYPVFKTDFGTIGIEICYDNFFPEVARNLMLNGARIIFCPIWGDIRGMNETWNVTAKSRAIDNAVFFVSSMYEPWGSLVVDPNGRVLSQPGKTEGMITADLHLNRRTFERWLSVSNYGEWKNLIRQERRPEIY